ncbi:MAG: hypothetical protein KJZ86_02955 [Caldilineaceae bacterium]|nr:hypothetical protein [Caldilineaceae bacterium]HRJ40406.1 hypothetical protein [Caldilineaceae bacterium]
MQAITFKQTKETNGGRFSSNPARTRNYAAVTSRRRGRAGQHRPQYSPYFFMALIVTVFSSIAFVTILTIAVGAG